MIKKLSWFFIILGVFSGLYILGQRMKIEEREKKVELVLDYPSLKKFCLLSGWKETEGFARFKFFARLGIDPGQTAEEAVGNGGEDMHVLAVRQIIEECQQDHRVNPPEDIGRRFQTPRRCP